MRVVVLLVFCILCTCFAADAELDYCPKPLERSDLTSLAEAARQWRLTVFSEDYYTRVGNTSLGDINQRVQVLREYFSEYFRKQTEEMANQRSQSK